MIDKIKTCAILNIVFLIINVQAQDKIFSPDVSGNPQENTISVNELHMVPDSGRSGYPIKITYTINNTDQFTGIQFDIILPSVITFIQDSVWLFRKTNHIIIANLVNQQTLRILAFSPTNAPFTGNDGEIVSVKFNLNGSAGTYNVGLNNVVITNAIGTNILTAFYPSYIKIISPDISGLTEADFGEVSVLDTLSYDYQLSNTGNDTLIVTEFFSSESYFWNATSLPQSVLPSGSKTFNLKFHNINKGQYSAFYTIVSNDPDENPFFLDVTAASFAPNYILIQNAEVYVGDTVTLKIDVNNYEQFFDFQVDLDFPDSLFYVPNSAALTDRKQDHVLFTTLLTSNKIRLFTFSLNELPFTGDSGTVATMNFVAGNDTGTFPLHLSGGILSDSASQNIIRGTIDGEIHIQERPRFQVSVNITNGWNMVSIPGLHPANQNVNTWWTFRDPGANVFRYSGGYIPVTFANPGIGYWMKHNGARTYNTGDEWPASGIQVADHDPLSGTAGWNLIGGYELSVPTANLTTIPPGLQSGPIYKYSGSYQVAATLDPGYGYWMKLSAAGQIIIPEVLAKGIELTEYFPEHWGKIIFTDAAGISYILYALKGNADLSQYELPPAPMAGMFDIRYSSGRIAEEINNESKTVEMSGVNHPVKVKAENIDITLQDETGLELNVNLKNGEEITISDASIMKLKVSGEIMPDKYALKQNYPNPFNPSTTIEFSLPEDVNGVKLTIYNVLGERVAELVNGSLMAGKYSYQWNAQNVATGMYIYELRTNNFVSIKKMVLMK